MIIAYFDSSDQSLSWNNFASDQLLVMVQGLWGGFRTKIYPNAMT